jgi:hypothetical protein
MAVYSIFERFLYDLFGYIKRSKMSVSPQQKKRRYLDLSGYKKVLKANGVNIASSRGYRELEKLRDFRNAIAHQGVWVTEDNEPTLKRYRFKEGDHITVSEAYFRSSATFVRHTCQGWWPVAEASS